MITYFEYIKNLGVFNDYKKPANCKKFEQYNLIYGLNGSGKTTLSRFFRDLKTGAADGFPSLKYKVKLKDNTFIKEGSTFPKSIRVFNSDYVEANVGSCEGKLNPIYILGQDNNALVAEIENDEKLLVELAEKLSKAESDIQDKSASERKVFTQIAVQIKSKVVTIQWGSYNRTKAMSAYEKLDREGAVNESEYRDALASLSQPALALLAEIQDPQTIIEPNQIETSVRECCKENAITNAISDLQDNPTLLSWIETGMDIHRDIKFDQCEFCKQPFPDARKEALEQHFSDSDAALKQKIVSLQNSIAKLVAYLTDPLTYRNTDFYTEFQKSSEEKRAQLITVRSEICAILDNYSNVLNEKLKRRGESYHVDLSVINAQPLYSAVFEYNSIIQQNNAQTNKFNERIGILEKKVEQYLLTTITKEIETIRIDLAKLEATTNVLINGDEQNYGITKLKKTILEKKAKVSDSHRGADSLTSKLETFLGRDELKFEQEGEGYRITRYGRAAQRLSEGEKTAVAFIYFATTLSDRGFDLAQSILVIDDPISSLDSNSLYQAFGFLKTETKDAMQVFYLTHNFDFLKLMLNWLGHSSNKKCSSFWMLNSSLNATQIRNATITELDKTLQHCSSEVSYLFKILYRFHSDGSDGTIESTYHLPNIIRKVMESFLEHNRPRATSMYKQLEELSFDEQKKTALYKYSNDLSHPTLSNIDPAQAIETKTNIGHLFEMMKTIAPAYFNALEHEAKTYIA